MIAIVNGKTPPPFEPVKIEITLESQDELDVFSSHITAMCGGPLSNARVNPMHNYYDQLSKLVRALHAAGAGPRRV